jgi:hypothetical protein
MPNFAAPPARQSIAPDALNPDAHACLQRVRKRGLSAPNGLWRVACGLAEKLKIRQSTSSLPDLKYPGGARAGPRAALSDRQIARRIVQQPRQNLQRAGKAQFLNPARQRNPYRIRRMAVDQRIFIG